MPIGFTIIGNIAVTTRITINDTRAKFLIKSIAKMK